MINSKIEWTDSTWNPITGCTPVSEGCRNCYAKGIAKRFPVVHGGLFSEIRFHEDRLMQPLKWKKPRKIFVCSMGDLFHEDVQVQWLNEVFRVIQNCRQHTFIVLTKRPERAKSYLRSVASCRAWPEDDVVFPNVWLGVTAENQEQADKRIPILLDTPAAVRVVSVEPMLGYVDLDIPIETGYGSGFGLSTALGYIDGVLCGGESGPNARPMHPDWARSLRDQCVAAGVPFFFKQWGEWTPFTQLGWVDDSSKIEHLRGPDAVHGDDPCPVYRVGKKAAGRLLDGREWNELPGDAR